VAEVRVEFEFEDSNARAPSSQTYAYFPAARGFFRYACPCQTCSGEFDLSGHVSELAAETGRRERSLHVDIPCAGQRVREMNVREACQIRARVTLTATPHSTEQSP
jgi:hypothetical protein